MYFTPKGLSQEVIISLVLDGFYAFGAGVMLAAILRFSLWKPARVNVRQFREPFHSKTCALDRAIVIGSYLTFSIVCLIFMKDIVDYFFLGAEHQHQQQEPHHRECYLHRDSYLLLMTHHVTSIFLIGFCSLHGSSILAVFALVGLSCINYSGAVDFMCSTVPGVTLNGVWYCYEVANMVCYLATIWSMLARAKNWEGAGVTASKKAALMWMFSLHVANLCCNTDMKGHLLAHPALQEVLLPISLWTAKASLLVFFLGITILSCYVFFTEEEQQRASSPSPSHLLEKKKTS